MPEEDKDAIIAELRAENERLRQKVDLLLRKLFGSSSEKLDPDQLQLLLDPDGAKKPCAADCDEVAPAAEPEAPRSRAPRRRKPGLPEDLEVVETVLIPDEVREEPEAHRKIGEEVSERLQYEPPRYWLERTVRETYVKQQEPSRAPLTAPLGPCLLEGSLLSPSLAAQVITAKYCDHLPFYRQEQILAHRHDIRIGRNTLCHWAEVCAHWLEPLYRLLAADLRQQDWLHVDESPLGYLAPGNGTTKTGYFWAYGHPEVGVLYDWHTGRSHECLDSVLTCGEDGEDFQGILVTDGFGAYETWQRKHEGVSLAACWAHVRRKFHEALAHHPKEAAVLLDLIAQLFRIEAGLRNQRAGPPQVMATRQSQSAPLLEEIKTHLTTLRHCLPKSSLGKARDYTLGLWSRLEVFLAHEQIPIDNNYIENAIRPTKLGAKNWLFIGGADTGQRSAILYTMVENVRKAHGNPYAYLRDVLTRLPAMTNQDDLRPLLPANWIAAQRLQNESQRATVA